MEETKELLTPTATAGGNNPNWSHGKIGSTRAHNELAGIVDNSLNREDFIRQLNNWANYRLTNGVDDLPPGLRQRSRHGSFIRMADIYTGRNGLRFKLFR